MDFASAGIYFQSSFRISFCSSFCKIAMLPGFVLLQNFQPMYNQMAAVWVASNLPPPPLDVRIVSVTGQSVTAV